MPQQQYLISISTNTIHIAVVTTTAMASATGEQLQQYPQHFKGVKALVDSGVQIVPEKYVKKQQRAEEDYPVIDSPDLQIPIIDLENLVDDDEGGHARAAVVRAIGDACRQWGFFVVINHGVSSGVIEEELRVGREFFALPTEEKMRYFDTDPKSLMRYGTSFNVRNDAVLNWRDFLRYSCRPLPEMSRRWPESPPDFRRVNAEYVEEIAALARRLLAAISESLGLPRQYVNDQAFGGQAQHSQYMAYNYYPPCPEPERVVGLAGHSDPGGLTLLLQDGVSGLQVLHEERHRGRENLDMDHVWRKNCCWVPVKPLKGSIVVNVGDQLQLVSNAAYPSALHRVAANASSDRLSVATAYGPSLSTVVGPAAPLVGPGKPALYRSCVYGDFLDTLESGSLHNRSVLESLRISPSLDPSSASSS